MTVYVHITTDIINSKILKQQEIHTVWVVEKFGMEKFGKLSE